MEEKNLLLLIQGKRPLAEGCVSKMIRAKDLFNVPDKAYDQFYHRPYVCDFGQIGGGKEPCE